MWFIKRPCLNFALNCSANPHTLLLWGRPDVNSFVPQLILLFPELVLMFPGVDIADKRITVQEDES